MKNLNKLLIETKKVVEKVGLYAEKEFRRFSRSQIEHKSNPNDLVSYVDREVEKHLVAQLLKLTPGAAVIAEENTSQNKSAITKTAGLNEYEFTWIIDPIDGTTNFVHGIPIFALSVALVYKTRLVLGIIYNPASKEMFYATSETPAKLNGKAIQVSQNSQTKRGIISVGISPVSLIGKTDFDQKSRQWFFKTLPVLMRQVRGVRALGSAAMSLAWVASGRLDAYYEQGLNAWDIAAGGLIIRQAGGRVTDFSKQKDFLFKRELIATGKMYNQFYTLLKNQGLV